MRHIDLANKIKQELLDNDFEAGYYNAINDCVFELREFDINDITNWLISQLMFNMDDVKNDYQEGYNKGVEYVLDYIESLN